MQKVKFLSAEEFSTLLPKVLYSCQDYPKYQDYLGLDTVGYTALQDMLVRNKMGDLLSLVVVHACSQIGIYKFRQAVIDGLTLSELFDWSITSEGWGFWNKVNKLIYK